MTRIPAKTREEAALICAIAASTPEFAEAYGPLLHSLRGTYPESSWCMSDDDVALAMAAWRLCQHEDHPDAEAHALLMSGWTPGETP